MRSLPRWSLFVLLPLLSDCTDAPTEPDLESPVLQIASGASSPSGRFFFLPPIAAGTGFSGTFDAGLLSQLQVRVCALSSGATPACTGADIVSFSSSTSPAILLDAVGENYSVTWSTKKGGLSTGINYRIRVLAGTVLLGFADLDVVSNKKQLASVPAGFVGLIKNGSLLIRFRVEAGVVGSVGVSPATATITSSGSQQFTATVTDLHGTPIASPTLLWSSSNTDAATVDQSGLASAAAAGTATITAASQGVEGTAALTVHGVSGELQATDDGYTATGNIAIAIADGTSDVLSNDQGTGTLTVSEVQGSSANLGVATNTTASGLGSITGKVTLNDNGSFSYDPPPGYTGTDQFTYRITDGSSSSNLATVTITVSDMMWFVCDACGGDNRGTLTEPFTSVAAFTTANTGAAPAPQPNQKLYIRSGTYDGASNNLTLRDGQLAFGQGVAATTVFTPDANSVADYAGLTAGTAPVIAPSSGNGVNLASGNTLRGFDVAPAAGVGITGTNFGALTVTGVSITSSVAGLSLTTGSASATGVTFGSITSGGGTNNIKLANLSGTNPFALGSGALSGASGNAFDVENGTVPISYSGSIASTAARPVRVENYDGGTIALSGAVSGSANGVLLNANTGATISFTGGLSLSTGANAAFTATGGGTVTATQNNTSIVNTLATTTGTALDVQNTTIGAAGLTFRSISANGGANGIFVNNTGSSGGVTVTGVDGACGWTGAATTTADCDGGTIQNTTGRGAVFISTGSVSLKFMNFSNTATTDLVPTNAGLSTGNNLTDNAAVHLQAVSGVTLDRIVISGSAEQGINGHFVTNFSLTNSSLENTGNGSDEDGLHFYNILGTCAITSTSITSSGDDNINVQNNTNLTFPSGMTPLATLTITGGRANTGVLGRGYLMGISGTSNTTVTVDGVTADNNFSGGIVIDAFDDATSVIEIKNSTIINNNNGIALSSHNGSTKFDIHDNVSFAENDFVRIDVRKSESSTTGTLQGKIRNNPIVVENGTTADAISVDHAGGSALNIAITGNTITYAGTQRVINLQGGQNGAAQLHATVTGNNLAILLDGTGNATTGILAQVALASPSGDNSQMCADIGGAGALANIFSHPLGGALAAGDIRVRQRFVTTVRLPGYGGGATDVAAVISYLAGRNTEVSSPTATVDAGSFLGGAACTQPVFP